MCIATSSTCTPKPQRDNMCRIGLTYDKLKNLFADQLRGVEYGNSTYRLSSNLRNYIITVGVQSSIYGELEK